MNYSLLHIGRVLEYVMQITAKDGMIVDKGLRKTEDKNEDGDD